MKIVIDIPDSDYERIKDLVTKDNSYTTATTIGTAYQVIANGTPYEDRPQGEWIPVNEKLPNICGVYNVTKRVIEGGRRYYIADSCYFDGTRNWHNDNRINFGREYVNSIIAWQPLPEPYKEAEE
jgi:hypothetical protein